MKKRYLTPTTEWVVTGQVEILAGSVPTADGQSNPTIGSREDEDIFSLENQLFGGNELFITSFK